MNMLVGSYLIACLTSLNKNELRASILDIEKNLCLDL